MARFWLRIRRKSVLKFSRWWHTRFGERSLIVMLAIAVGAIAALAAAILHWLVTSLERFGLWLEASGSPGWFSLLFILPFLGLALSMLIQKTFGGVRYAKSLSPLILSLARRKTNIPDSEMFTHMISSAFSVGLGGSAGLEAPSVLTGAAIGANVSSFLNIERRHRSLLLGCGAAAAISAIFNSPIGGVLFAVEVLLPQFSVAALVPMLISSAIATVISRLILSGSDQVLLAINAPWKTNAIPFYFLCGGICALIGVFVIKSAYSTTAWIKKSFRKSYQRLFVGGSSLCLLLAIFPLLRGQGYLFIEQLFAGNMENLVKSSALLSSWIPYPVLLTLLLLAGIFLKVFASVLTVESGGDGGIFAPSMFIGAFTGFTFARLINLTGIIELQEPNFVVVGMCGVFTAVMRAPLTGIFLIAEVTGSYILLVPLMIVSAVSWFCARKLEPESIYRKVLVESKLLVSDRDQNVLQLMPVRLHLESNFTALNSGDPMAKMREYIEQNSRQEVFPVLDEKGFLVGVVRIEAILSAMLDIELSRSLLVFDLMEPPRGQITEDDDLAWAMTNLERYNLKFLPVVSNSGKFLGFISRTKIFSGYRRQVRDDNDF